MSSTDTYNRLTQSASIYISPEVCVEDVSVLVTGDMSEVVSDLGTGEQKYNKDRPVHGYFEAVYTIGGGNLK